MARKVLRLKDVQMPTDVVGFDKDISHWDWSMRDVEDEEDEEDEQSETETFYNQPSSTTQEEISKTNISQKPNKPRRSAFGQAFDKARAAGKKTFWWRGTEYNTKTKAEVDAEKKSANNKKSNTSNISRSSSNNKNITTSNKKSNVSSNTTKKVNKTNTTKTSNKPSYLDYVKQTARNVSDAEKKQAAGNNKQKHINANNVNNVKSVSSQVAERRRLANRNNQLSTANDFNAYQDYRNNYNFNVAKAYLNRAMQKSKTSPAFTADEIKAINRAEANKRKRNR